ncbi:hypothetical protein [Thalassotalea atypica]|uniref:hypothetical protein n=1 Tax=Thalassotalea atypica TaxID=2054316 RepID=UPI002572A309|nr:hypothetical protein [Thalassotalea atypica]
MNRPIPDEINKAYIGLIEDYQKTYMGKVINDEGEMPIFTSVTFIMEKCKLYLAKLNQESIYGESDAFTLRNDAILFLMTNIHQMVFLPLQSAYGPNLELYSEVSNEHFNINDFYRKIEIDIEEIINCSVELAKKRERKDIPASIVLEASGSIIFDLNMKSFRIWENIYVPAR